jgi:hypothetical protein
MAQGVYECGVSTALVAVRGRESGTDVRGNEGKGSGGQSKVAGCAMGSGVADVTVCWEVRKTLDGAGGVEKGRHSTPEESDHDALHGRRNGDQEGEYWRSSSVC